MYLDIYTQDLDSQPEKLTSFFRKQNKVYEVAQQFNKRRIDGAFAHCENVLAISHVFFER